MAPEPEWPEVERLFDAALEQPPEQRLSWLATATPDPGLRNLLARMLAAHAAEGGPLDRALDAGPLSLHDRLQAALADRYQLDDEIGRGGMATVYRARERKHDRPVVLKVLNPENALTFGADRFLAEIHVAAQLSHPHILALIDSGEADGLLYYVMPWLGGETLRQRLRRGDRLPMPLVLRVLHDIADALATAHAAGVIHRDLKPENILLAGDHAYLLDFGIAQLRLTEERERITGQGAVIGTMGYMAPEQEGGGRTDHRVDIYAWGVLAREMLTGQQPGLFATVLPETLPPDTPAPLATLVARCLQPNPAERPEDMAEVRNAVTGLRERRSVASSPPKRRRWPLRLALGAAVLAVAGWVIFGRSAAAVPLGELAMPVAVAPLQNETGDSALGTWGRMAGDWITQGLQETGIGSIIPWPNAREAAERAPAGSHGDPVKLLRAETGAATVITGSYYLVGDRIRFQAQITDAARGTLLAAPPPAEAPRDSAEQAVRLLRTRVMGALAIRRDERVARIPGLAERPPTFEAYRAFDRALAHHLAQDYDSASAAFLEAFRLDSTFGITLLYAAIDLWNEDRYAEVDSSLRTLRSRALPLSEYHELLAAYLGALLVGEGDRAFGIISRAADLSGDFRGLYAIGWSANATNRPRDALDALRKIDPDVGSIRRWAPYWVQRAHAEHRLGDYAAELASARAMKARHPESRIALVLEVRAVAATGNTALVDSLLDAQSSLPTDTYWSQGAAMVVAGEELAAHGRAFATARYYNRAVRWVANHLARDPHHRAHRYWMGSALYDAGRWLEAEPYFESLARDYPNRRDYRLLNALAPARARRRAEAERRLGPRPAYAPGEHTVARARLAAIAGKTEVAIALLAQAASEGYEGFPWLHSVAFRDLSPLVGNPAYDALISPQPFVGPRN